MAQITSGVRSVLSSPVVYDVLQNIMGAGKVRRELVDVYIRPENGCRILDLGCGTAEILKYLPSSIEYWGVDASQKYIDSAKKIHGTRGVFHCGLLDEFKMSSMPAFDRILALGVLHHLDDSEVANFFSLAKRMLSADGHVITIDPCYVERQNPIARYLISKDRGRNVREASAYHELAVQSFGRVNGFLRHRAWIPYTHWIMECS